jgi:two-component system, cell cycle response regulator
VAARTRATMVLFDLNGFKSYNDTFGHPAGDALLARLGRALADAIAGHGTAWRLGGDEFCVIAEGADPDAALAACSEALSISGEGFSVSAAHGVVELPDSSTDPEQVLRLADERMYAHKGMRRRAASPAPVSAALLQIVREQDPALGEHITGVAALAVDVARRVGADPTVIEQARLGGELHDIGKTAIPATILSKPGPLDDEEWAFMRRHTTIGERILLADPDLAFVAPVARSHHERWDGAGYPDGKAGKEIPLAARIVAVCDAYEAMIGDRPYREPLSRAEALAELRHCAGGQFDPRVVEAFCAIFDDSGALLPDPPFTADVARPR